MQHQPCRQVETSLGTWQHLTFWSSKPDSSGLWMLFQLVLRRDFMRGRMCGIEAKSKVTPSIRDARLVVTLRKAAFSSADAPVEETLFDVCHVRDVGERTINCSGTKSPVGVQLAREMFAG
jgi:hypothetical protein